MRSRISISLTILVRWFNRVSVALADGYGWLNEKNTGSDVFGPLDRRLKILGGSAFYSTRTIVILCLSIAVLFIGLNISQKNSKIREEAKEHLVHFFFGAILLFGILTIASIAMRIGIELNR